MLEALHERNHTGRGVAVKISMFDCRADWIDGSVPCTRPTPVQGSLAHRGYTMRPSRPYGPLLLPGENKQVGHRPSRMSGNGERFCRVVLQDMRFKADDLRYIRNYRAVG